jgi:hypothetical protein
MTEDDRDKRQAWWRLLAYVFVVVAISCFLLILNVGIVYTLFAGVAQFTLQESYAQKVGQFLLFIGPFLLLFPEWYVYDVFIGPRSLRS